MRRKQLAVGVAALVRDAAAALPKNQGFGCNGSEIVVRCMASRGAMDRRNLCGTS